MEGRRHEDVTVAGPRLQKFERRQSILAGVARLRFEKDAAFAFANRAAREEGLLIGVSSGASLAAVSQKLKELPAGSRVLTFCYDTGERYLSIEGLFA